jgi:tetratricopeptide (TPR) repeat protein
LHENGRGEKEFAQGNLRAAFTRFTQLLACMEAQPEDSLMGRKSYEYSITRLWLARCFRESGQLRVAEVWLREILSINETWLKEQPGNASSTRLHDLLLTDLGEILRMQGKYTEAREIYEERLKVAWQQRDRQAQAVVQGQLGFLAFLQQDYDVAWSCYTSAYKLSHTLNAPANEATILHQLGLVAQEQEKWTEAEHCYRESLAIEVRLDHTARAAQTCNQLAIVACRAGRPNEAEGWYKQALEMHDSISSNSPQQATVLNNIASLLVNEIRAGRIPVIRLTEAQNYAERVLAIRETLDSSSEIWKTLNILATIAEMKGQAKGAQDYHHREHEAFAAFAGNRSRIDQEFGELIEAIASAATGDKQAQEFVEEVFSGLEENNWPVVVATQRILKGKREWHSLSEGMNSYDALLVLRVLEKLALPAKADRQPTDQ